MTSKHRLMVSQSRVRGNPDLSKLTPGPCTELRRYRALFFKQPSEVDGNRLAELLEQKTNM